jgi:MFS family permease
VRALVSPYSEVLRGPGALAFTTSALVARVPISMLGLGVVLLVSGSRGSYGQAGVVAAALLLSLSVAQPLQARVADRLGQPRVVGPLLAVHAGAVVALVLAVQAGLPVALVALAAAAVGASLPPFGSFVRARWSFRLAGTSLLPTAFALESVLDEVIFVVGPVLVTLVATQVGAGPAVAGTLLFTCGGGLAYLLCRSSVPPRHRPEPGDENDPLPWRTLLPLVAAFVGMGAAFGAVEVSTVAFADELGRLPQAGLVLAAFAAGSMVAGIAFGALAPGQPTRRRFVLGLALLALALVPTALVSSLAPLALVLAVAGLAISPTLITGFGLAEHASARSRVTEALAWTNTSLAVGVAAGAAVAGPLIDQIGASGGFLVVVGGGVVGAAASLLLPRRRAAVLA